MNQYFLLATGTERHREPLSGVAIQRLRVRFYIHK